MAQSQAGTVCPECGTALAPGTQFCGECGAKVPQAPRAATEASVGAIPAKDVASVPASASKPRPKAHTVMGIDVQASKFASALAQVEARAKADNEAKQRDKADSEPPPAIDPADADAKARAEAEAEAEAIIARAQAEAEKAYAAEDKIAAAESTAAASSGEEPAAANSAADSSGGSPPPTLASDASVADAGSDAPAQSSAEASGPTAVNVDAADGGKVLSPSAGSGADAGSGATAAGDSSANAGTNAGAGSGADPGPSGSAGSNAGAAATPAATLGGGRSTMIGVAAGSTPAASQPQPRAAAPNKPAPRVIVPERGTPAAAKAAVQASRRGLSHTMLGLSDEVIKAATSSAATAPAATSSSTNKDADGPREALPRGITPVPATPVSVSGQRAPARSAPKGTLLGIQMTPGAIPAPARALDKTQIEGEQPEDAGSAPASAASAPGLGSTRVEGARGTALGIGIPQAAPKRNAPQGRTMLGVPVASIKPPAAADAARSGSMPPRDSSTARAVSEEPASIPPTIPKRSTRMRTVLILASLALLTIIAMVYLRLSGGAGDADVSARIITGQDGETLLFEVPEAREGSSIRFGGQEQPLVAGRATFPLASDSLRVGENVVLADVVGPDGETSSARIVLSVFYRIWVDTSSLRVDKPTVDVVVTAVPGTKVMLEGQDVALDKQGRATKTYPVDITRPGKGGVIEHVVHYRMQPPEGETVVDELHTRIAVAMMQIDRPGPDIVTDRESIEIAGAVGKDTQVDIDGSAVPVKDGRFVHTLALPRPGDYKPRVTAKAPGKIPNAVTLNIKRVRDLAQAAREFSYNKDLNYAKIAAEPTLYKGQSIAMEGRVYATVPRAGSSVIQMLARPCPASQRCSVWVVDPQGTEVSVDRFVRILGTLDGEQQFRSEKNEIVTVPKIIARFVLPAKP